MEVRPISISRDEFSIHELEEGMRVRADVGQHITDIRLALVVDIDEQSEVVHVIIGRGRMDSPYIIPPSNIYQILD